MSTNRTTTAAYMARLSNACARTLTLQIEGILSVSLETIACDEGQQESDVEKGYAMLASSEEDPHSDTW